MLPRDAAADASAGTASASPLPFVEIPPEARRADLPPLDPDATPRTELGELRARYLPLWTQAFDLAFPPHVCGTAWELDAIAIPVTGVNVSHYGDPATMAALAVMRYEYQVSRAMAQPTALAQLCVAVSALGSARTEALEDLKSRLGEAVHARSSISRPHEVTIIAVSPWAMLVAACVTPGSPAGPSSPDGSEGGSEPDGPRLGAYRLRVARGIEDTVVDVSYRVEERVYESSPGCAGDRDWIDRWRSTAQAWIDEGQLWTLTNATTYVLSDCDGDSEGDRPNRDDELNGSLLNPDHCQLVRLQ